MEKIFCGEYPVVNKSNPASNIYDYEIYCPEIAKIAVCGQFVNIKAEGYSLRRPISICDINKEKGTIRIIFEVRGKGTEKIAEIKKGELIDILAPLGGHGFDLYDNTKKAVIIGGGIGNPPLLPIAKFYGENSFVISGFKSAEKVILKDDFIKTGTHYNLCTDNGTAGKKAFVTDILGDILLEEKADIIYACGPIPMLKRIVDIAGVLNIETQISLEERMGCGVGACLVCACRVKILGEEKYLRVCREGPVFDGNEVIF